MVEKRGLSVKFAGVLLNAVLAGFVYLYQIGSDYPSGTIGAEPMVYWKMLAYKAQTK